ncbi:hypothetical protein BO71DRAFT_350457 [Aspergillus ellipticus CBS 707.79]|uniref:Peptidase S54 rhomboid domain-containing protein n=1 Tax=Aspergillus ellipticus CBS 707.79 TaxID=1448320 RepID=A0A319DEX8_9EURO|nr:hypothetical protein BO71DRAFT_350457 [Aspergillus ellipticus CBS 707.79]
MSNAFGVAWRIPCPGLCASSLLRSVAPSPPLRSLARLSPPPILPWRPDSISRRLRSSLSSPVLPAPRSLRPQSSRLMHPVRRCFSTSRSLYSSPQDAPEEHGTKPRSQPFSAAELNAIFGSRAKVSRSMGNRVLAVLQGRRLQGTLDLDLPADLTRSVRPPSLDAALRYLREHYPMDEDAAIMARIEREEQQGEGEDPNRYKPQSGSYGAELGKANDPSGKSVLQQMREENEARILVEQERKRNEWMEGAQQDYDKLQHQIKTNTALQKYDGTSALELRPRADPQQRPLLAWIQKHYLRAEEELNMTEIPSQSARFFPALAFTLLTLGLCYAFAVCYEPCAPADRMWPQIPRAAAAVIGLVGLNLGVFILWRLPPFWRLLNRYFMVVTVKPRVFSLAGNVFSHQQSYHLLMNMFFLWLFGPRLHDDVDRGEFLALYLAAGVVGSLFSLSASIFAVRWSEATLGASGAVNGIMAGWLMLHANDNFTLYFHPKNWDFIPQDWDYHPKHWNLIPEDWTFIPEDWEDIFVARGWVVLTYLVGLEIARLALNPITTVNYWAHTGGYLTGIVWALARKDDKKKPDEATNKLVSASKD